MIHAFSCHGVFPHWQARSLILVLALQPGPAAASLVINEFLPDPEGADAGQEFVELLNSGPQDIDLLGVSLEFGNGIEGPVWTSRWTCLQVTPLTAGQRFLIVDRNWMGESPGQAEVWLGLQNGPDAIRLMRDQQVLDMVGYGPLTDQQMMEATPAPVTPGLALARRPDGQDTNDNGRDFVRHTPTPGRPNFLTYDLQLMEIHLDPPSTDRTGVRVAVTASLKNAGTRELPSAPVFLLGFGGQQEALLDGTIPGETRQVTWFVIPTEPGRWPLRLVSVQAVTGDSLVVDAGEFQVGPAELYFNEVLPAPGAGQGEWIELACTGPDQVQLGAYQLRDEDGSWQDLPDAWLQGGDLVVIAQDHAGLQAWHLANQMAGAAADCAPENFPTVVHSLPGSWPTLNNSPPEGRAFSDRIYLANGSGTVLDHVTMGDAEAAAAWDSGISWERIALVPVNPIAENWSPCTSPATGTPGCPNSVSGSGGATARLVVDPVILDPERGFVAQHIRFQIGGQAQGWWLRVFDSWGELVRDMGGDLHGPGPRDLIWDGRHDRGQPVAQGVYVVLLLYRGAGGEILDREKAITVVRRVSGS